MSMETILAIALKEAKEIWRGRLFLILAFMVPSVMYIVFGFGISLDVEHAPLSILDQDRSILSRDLVNTFSNSRYFDVKDFKEDYESAFRGLQDGTLRAVIVIPHDFSRNILSSKGSSVEALIDGAYPFRANVVKGYIKAVMIRYSNHLIDDFLRGTGTAGRNILPIDVRVRYLYNESLESKNALVPMLIAVTLLMSPAILTSLAIVREKEYGTIYNIYATATRKEFFIIGKLIPYCVIASINVMVLFLWSKILFGVPFKGNFLLFYGGALLYVLDAVSIGLFVSLVTRSMVAAQIITAVITVIPAFIFSGFFAPVSNLGTIANIIAHLYPTMYFLEIIKGTFMKNLALKDLLPYYTILALYFFILMGTGSALFRKREG